MRILSKDDKENARYSFRKTTIASIFVAFAQSVIICPMELIKSRLQIQTSSANRLYNGNFTSLHYQCFFEYIDSGLYYKSIS